MCKDCERFKIGLETIYQYTSKSRHPNGVWDAHVIAQRLLAGLDQNGRTVPQRVPANMVPQKGTQSSGSGDANG